MQGAAGSPQFCCQRRQLWILREADWDANLSVYLRLRVSESWHLFHLAKTVLILRLREFRDKGLQLSGLGAGKLAQPSTRVSGLSTLGLRV